MFDQLRLYLGLAVAAALLAWQFWPALTAIAAKLKPKATAPSIAAAAVDENTLDYHALERLAARAERRNSAKCKAAVAQYFANWYTDGEA